LCPGISHYMLILTTTADGEPCPWAVAHTGLMAPCAVLAHHLRRIVLTVLPLAAVPGACSLTHPRHICMYSCLQLEDACGPIMSKLYVMGGAAP
jgi:hypothetical protein